MNKTWKSKLADMKVLLGSSGFGQDPINYTVTADKESRKKLKLHKGKKFKDYEVLLEILGDEGTNGDNMRSIGYLIDEEDIGDDLDNIGINTEFVPLTQNHVEFDYGQNDQDYYSTASTQVPTGTPPIVPIADPTTAPATGTSSTIPTTCTSSAIPTTGDHTSSHTIRSNLTAKRQRTRPTAHVLDMGINVITTELSRITSELVTRREFDWTMWSNIEAILWGITGFDITHLFTALEVITKEKPFCAWFLGTYDKTRRSYLRSRFGLDSYSLYDIGGVSDE
ncbi:hypothetical protein GIB67_018780 [Kingdonia uniflora]|uniref:Uncharacterized protein n=1 Tax=Kingdonia uniflora TaxID=39325 RepID=A0A7J7NDT6_9MAGN|nr:hypothetical protein GIB67_018780 [Kingdonia uniflora]